MTCSPDRNADLDRVLAVVDEMSGGRRESLLWLRQPLKAIKGQTVDVEAFQRKPPSKCTLTCAPPMSCPDRDGFGVAYIIVV